MAFSYEEVPYPARPLRIAHAEQLAVAGRLRGVPSARAEASRVLEIGCSDGGHLLPMALTMPRSRFVGIDLSGAAIGEGRRVASALGLANIELIEADLMTWEPGREQFDYVIAHGIYSWIPEAVRDRMMALTGAMLAPGGIAYISYNTYPGCHLRRMVSGMLHYHVDKMENPADRIAQSRELMKFLIAGQPESGYESHIVRTEGGYIVSKSDSNIFHDDLAEINDPVYFHEFESHAGRHGLRFLCEAEAVAESTAVFPAPVRSVLEKMGRGQREQYMDFLKCRRFRASLLVRAETEFEPECQGRHLDDLLVACPLRPVGQAPSLEPGKIEEFSDGKARHLQLDHPLSKAALLRMGQAYPRAIAFPALVEDAKLRAGEPYGTADHVEALRTVILESYAAGAIELHSFQPEWATAPGERPAATPLILLQAKERAPFVTSLRHSAIQVGDPVGAWILPLLDGTRTGEELLRELENAIANGEVGAESGLNVQTELEKALQRAADLAFLVA